MSWFILALLYVLLASFANILRKILLRDDRNDLYASAIVFQFLGGIIAGIVAFIHGFVPPPFSIYPLNFLLTTVLWGFATICMFKAYQEIEASEVTIITSLQAIVIIFAGIFFLHEIFTISNAIGALLIIISVIVISQGKGKLVFNKGVMYSLLYCIFAGFATTNEAYMVHHYDVLSYLTVAFFLPGAFLCLINPKALLRIKKVLKPVLLKKNIIFSAVYTISGIVYLYALAIGGQVSQVGTIAKSSVVITVLLATFFLNEQKHFVKKIICAILVTVGVVLLS
jgi:bacterial/archaeal transporter family protein